MEIAVIGAAGSVGAEIAFLLAQLELADKLILTDILEDKLKGVALDIEYSCAHKKTQVVIGNYKDLTGCDIIIICAGKPRTTEASRDDLIDFNSKILQSIISQINNQKALFLIVSNPVDSLVSRAVEFGIPKERVLGVSTLHDTMRLRAILKRHGVTNSKSYISGKHGEGNYKMEETVDLTKIKEEVDGAGMNIIKLRGFTSFGIAAATTEMVYAILRNKESIASVAGEGSIPIRFRNFKYLKMLMF